MTVFARSDLAHVFVSRAHGGCGDSHSRPVEQGAPAKIWRLGCPACEQHLRHDPLWSTTISEIPDTHDEKIMREDLDKRGAANQQQMTALALAKIAGIAGAEEALGIAMGSGITPVCPEGHKCPPGARFCVECGKPLASDGGMRRAPCGHAVRADAKFCTECGSPTADPEPEPEPEKTLPAAPRTPGVPPAAPGKPESPKAPRKPADAATKAAPAAQKAAGKPAEREPTNTAIRGMTRAELVDLARKRKVSDTGNRADLIARLLKKNGT